jgi:hypothetical protein
MKRILIALLVLALVVNFSSCERDDICVDGDTPLLVVGFFDFMDPTAFKPVTSLRIRAIDNDSILNSNEDFRFTDRSTVADSILIPLRAIENTTSYEFILDSATDSDTMEETGIIDTLGFSYNLGEQFVSRGCGFVANFNELDTLRTPSGEDWIRRITIVEENIRNNPTTIHVKIFH